MSISVKSMVFKTAIIVILSFVTIDIVKGVLPFTCSLPGHYHLTHYSMTTSSVASGVRYQSGRPVLNYSGGKGDCRLEIKFTVAGIASYIYSIFLMFVTFIASLPSKAVEMFIGASGLGFLVRLVNAVAAAAYMFIVLMNFYISDNLVFDLSKDELKTVKERLSKKQI